MKIAFCSDLHLNFVDNPIKAYLGKQLRDSDCDIVVVAGDTSEHNSLERELVYLTKWIEKEVFIVLGNHDYYGGSLFYTKELAASISEKYEYINYLPTKGIVELTKDTCLLGFDSMYDCLNGKFFGGKYNFELLDFVQIGELKFLNRNNIYTYMMNMGAILAANIKETLSRAFLKYKNAYLITHVPPYTEVCLYNGCASELEALPVFSNKQMGNAFLDVMEEYPNNNLTVLCGHTHSACERQITDNLKVIVAGARYCHPKVFSYIEL